MQKAFLKISNNFLIDLKNIKKIIIENQKQFNSSAEVDTFVYIEALIKKGSFIAIPKKKIKPFLREFDNLSIKIKALQKQNLLDTKKSVDFNLKNIKIANDIKKYLDKNAINFYDFSIVDYNISRRKSSIVISNLKGKEIEITSKEIGIDSYATAELFESILDKNLIELCNISEIDKVKIIDTILSDVTNQVNDEVTKISIKNRLTSIINNNGIDFENIEKIFQNAIMDIERQNIKDGLLNNIYSQKFYKQIIGNRDEDNAITYELVSNLKEKNKDLVFMFMDLNNFKDLNDKLGHDIGDKVLNNFSNELVKNVKDNGYVMRRGGDEFVIITSATNAKDIVNSLYSQDFIDRQKEALESIINSLDYDDGRKNYRVDEFSLSATVSAKTIPTVSKENCTAVLKSLDSKVDVLQNKFKPVSHFLNGSSRGEVVSQTEYLDAKSQMILSFKKELGIEKLDLWGKDLVVVSDDYVTDYIDRTIDRDIQNLNYEKTVMQAQQMTAQDTYNNFDLAVSETQNKSKLKQG